MSDYHPQPFQPEHPEPAKKGRKRLLLALATILAVIGLSLLGYYAYQDHQADKTREAAAAKKEAAKKAAEKAELERTAAIETCEDEIGDFVNALTEIDARLDVGLTQSDLSAQVGNASVERIGVDEDELPDFCLDALEAADEAFDLYNGTVTEWEDCIWRDYCDPDYSIDLQTPWAQASSFIEEARDDMSGEGSNA